MNAVLSGKTKWIGLACAASLACGTVMADPVDGFMWGVSWWAPFDATVSQYWEEGVVARDGGVAYFLGTQSPNVTFSTARTLRGLDFGRTKLTSGRPVLGGGQLTLTGDAFITGTGWGSNSSGWDVFADVNATIRGTGANTFTKEGYGILLVNSPLTDFATVVAGGGFLRATSTSGALYATDGTTFAVRGGTFDWQPATASGASATATLGATTYGPYGGSIAWSAGSGDAATLTVASLASEQVVGSTLEIAPSGGAATLGTSEKLLVSTPPAEVNGLLDPGIVVRETGVESGPIRFTRYDTEKGIVPYPVSSMVDLATAGTADVAVVTTSSTLETSKQVAALSLEDSANLVLSNDVTLTVGDGTHPAGVVFNFQSNWESNVSFDFTGAGTLDFGTSPGVIWASSPSYCTVGGWGGNRRLNIHTRVTGSAGVTLASRTLGSKSNSAGIFLLQTGYAAWTGPTYVAGSMLWPSTCADLPAGDLYVLSGSGVGGMLRLGTKGTLDQNIFLAGRGCFGDSSSALELPDGWTTFNGAITLTDDTWVSCSHAGTGGAYFRGPVKGPGDLHLLGVDGYSFFSTNTYADLYVEGANTTLNLVTNGTLGAGRVWVRAAGLALNLSETAGLVITNRFRCEQPIASINLDHAQPTIASALTASKTTLKNFSSLAIGGTVDLGDVAAVGAWNTTATTYRRTDQTSFTLNVSPEQITAARADAEARVGTASDSVLGLPLADGAGTLALTKKGAGTLELPAVSRTYSGATTVAAGTLKLSDDPLASKSILWWLDASREQDFDKAADGTVTNWHSRVGSFTFSSLGTNATWGTASKINGHDVVTFPAINTRMKGSAKATHRTVFIVYRFNEPRKFAGLFGATSSEISEHGVRIGSASASATWDPHITGYCFNTTGSIRQDGKTGQACGQGVAHILTLVHDRDNWPMTVYWGGPTVVPTFTPYLNFYGAVRPYLGDYAELIAYDRVLSETEIRRVENYLSEKWLAKKLWTDDQVAAPAALPAASALTVATGATLDLNGVSATVASLSGSGTITNSSATAATLTVTGDANFAGAVGGAVTLATGGTAELAAVATEGATFVAAGGTLATGTHVFTPSTNGLAYWCDAGRSETILCNASGAVTSWLSRASSSATALVNNGGNMPNTVTRLRPAFTAAERAAMNGRPGVYFANGVRALWADVKSPVRTVFIAVKLATNQNNCNGLWGVSGRDCGYRFSNNTASMEGQTSVVQPTTKSDRVRMDGLATYSFGTNAVRVFSARMGSTDSAFFADLGLESPTPTRTTVLGAYCGNPAIDGYVGEVIAYDRVLDDAEMLRVENYLAAKWKTTTWVDGAAPAESESTFAGSALEVGTGATATVPNGTHVGTLAGGGTLSGNVTADGFNVTVKSDGTTDTLTVDGTLTLSDASVLTVFAQEYLRSGLIDTFVRATAITGRFAASNLVKPNGHTLHATEGRLFHSAGLAIIFR